VIAILRIVRAFARRNLLTAWSYKFNFVLNLAFVFVNILVFFFIARIFDGVDSPLLSDANGNYFSYVLIGMISAYLLNVAMGAMMQDIRAGQSLGTLEAMLATPMPMASFLAASGLYNFIAATLRVVGLLVVGSLFLGVQLNHANIPAAFLLMVITMLCFSSLGLLSAAFILAFKKGNPVSLLIQTSFTMLGGVIFPVTVLPAELHGLAKFIPMTYVTSGMREALLQGASLSDLQSRLIPLGLMTIICFPIALWAFTWGLRKAKREGSLGQH
jgi:ABC-2 type transport system permease protein